MKIAAYLFLLFGLISLGLGIAMVIDKTLLTQFSDTVRTVFIVMLFLYGIYRIWSSVSAMRRTRQNAAK
ncbi:MAG: hypothetical protein ACHQM6_08825 [Candidatus Kapaibacterium sp.]